MTLSRRKALTLLCGGTILAAGTAAGGFLTTRTPHKALAPWEAAGTYADPRKWALSYALLAPNAHNRQPWAIALEGEDTITLWRDEERALPETDPFHRQLTISLGCFLELMVLAAAERGLGTELTLYPEGAEGPVAIAKLSGTATPDPLFAAALDRRSCKEPFEDRPIPPAIAQSLAAHAEIHTDPAMVDTLKALTWAAWLTEMRTDPALKESVDLMRFGKAEINANPDGIDLGGPFLESLILAGVLSREGQMDRESAGFQQGVAIYEEMLHATPAYASITTPGNTRAEQIGAGRQWLRLNLATTLQGLALHPVSQALQEYAEMAPHYAEAHRLLAAQGHTVQMLGRLGYGPQTPRTPRWPLETRLI